MDDYSKFTWTFFLKSEEETFDVFIMFAKMVQNNLNCHLMSLRKNPGTKLENSKCLRFYTENGVVYNFSAPRKLQQNRVTKRKNRSLGDMARTMLIADNLSSSY